MTGIYILDTEMPENCYECQFAANYFRPIHKSGRKPCSFACVLTQKSLTSTKRNRFCPLVAVPDHTRLIDADAMKETFSKVWKDNGFYSTITAEVVDNTPTIIEVES
jgi:hypothetical protein